MKSTHVDNTSTGKTHLGVFSCRMLNHRIQWSRMLHTHTNMNHAEGEGWELEHCDGGGSKRGQEEGSMWGKIKMESGGGESK